MKQKKKLIGLLFIIYISIKSLSKSEKKIKNKNINEKKNLKKSMENIIYSSMLYT